MWMRGSTFWQIEQWPGGLTGKTLCTKTPPFSFSFSHFMSAALTLKHTKWKTSGLLPRPESVISESDNGPLLPREEERNSLLWLLWCRSLSVPAWPLIAVHTDSEDIFSYCLARSLALNAACHTGSSCWWKHMPSLCFNLYNFLCLFAYSLPPPPNFNGRH